jgi:hypothetical protein
MTKYVEGSGWICMSIFSDFAGPIQLVDAPFDADGGWICMSIFSDFAGPIQLEKLTVRAHRGWAAMAIAELMIENGSLRDPRINSMVKMTGPIWSFEFGNTRVNYDPAHGRPLDVKLRVKEWASKTRDEGVVLDLSLEYSEVLS